MLPSGSSFSKIFHSLLSQREGRFPECLAALLQRQGRAGADHEARDASCALPELLEWGRPGLRIRRRDLEVAQGSRRAKAGRSEDQPRLIARWALLRQRNQRHFATRRLSGWHATCHRGAWRGLCGRSSQRQNAAHHDHAGTRKQRQLQPGRKPPALHFASRRQLGRLRDDHRHSRSEIPSSCPVPSRRPS